MAKTPLLLSNVIDADHQNSCLFTIKGHFAPPLWGLIGVLAQFQPLQIFGPNDHWDACWFPLRIKDTTVNIDIFAFNNFRGFMKMDNFA